LNYNFNPLIAIPSPRDIAAVKEALDSIQIYDKLWIKYSPEHITYPLMRHQFLNHKSQHYTHLVICPDDLLIHRTDLDILFYDYENVLETEEERQNTILSGYCNVDTSNYSKYANVTRFDVDPDRSKRSDYKWISLKEMEKIEQDAATSAQKNKFHRDYLIDVKFAGFPLFIIPRNIIENIEFRNDSHTGKFDDQGCCVDVMFCHDVIKKGYKILVDCRVQLEHLKYSDISTSALLQKQAKTPDDYYYYFEYSKEIKVIG
jgi:hypothetical protein